MTTRTRATLLKGVAITVAALTALTVPAVPAAADETPCGHQVGGDILAKYNQIGGQGSPLGCPTSDELTTPNGKGKFNTFVGGAIYWTPTTGAHPVWGVIRDKWGALGWEEGKLGFPVGDELTNSDGNGKRQQFEGGTVYWHPTLSNGAHPVWGKIGEQWGEFGQEGGPFGYPTSDEERNDSYNGYVQRFAKNNTLLFWSKSMGEKQGTCEGECIGYEALSDAKWVKRTMVRRAVANGDLDVVVIPTEAGFDDADTDYDALWDQTWKKVPYPDSLVTDEQGSSIYKQLACHARYAYELPDGSHTSHESWDLEAWRRDVSWDFAMNPLVVPFPFHQCNW